MDDKLRILILEDVAEDAELMEREIRKGGIHFQSHLVKTRQAFLQRVTNFKPDLILADYKIPSFDGLTALGIAREKCPNIPFIFVSGTLGDEIAVEALKKGATDYVAKERLFRLVPCIQRAMHEVEEKRKRQRTENALRESEERYRRLVEVSPEMIMLHEHERYVYLNPAALKAFGALKLGEIAGRSIFDLLHPDCWEIVRERLGLVEQGNKLPPVEEKFIRLDKKIIDVEVTHAQTLYQERPMILVVGRDITEKKKAEKEKAALQTQYYQAQKMEAVGQLAGGFAHDFNNSLTLISVCSQMVLMEMGKADPLREKIETIYSAIESSANLARQLLAFSRRQIMQMKVLDLNILVRDLERMAHRVIGENIKLSLDLDPELGAVNADPGQTEQMIINLIVNAKDAMPDGGSLTIRTENVELPETFAKLHPEVIPGAYVSLTVSDTGTGILPEIQNRIFEPFFTTKEKGKGTGLGLSSAYGIVKQSKGYIYAESNPGEGATFRVYFPRLSETPMAEETKRFDEALPRGSETILVVEDEKPVLDFTAEVLSRQGYKVLKAANGGEAFLISEKHRGPIELMVTDVIMPGINGKALADRCSSLRPDLKILYMSGYSYDQIGQHGVLNKGVHFIQKPFTFHGLAAKVRRVLEQVEAKVEIQPDLFGSNRKG